MVAAALALLGGGVAAAVGAVEALLGHAGSVGSVLLGIGGLAIAGTLLFFLLHTRQREPRPRPEARVIPLVLLERITRIKPPPLGKCARPLGRHPSPARRTVVPHRAAFGAVNRLGPRFVPSRGNAARVSAHHR
jgi:hypothetical protein